MLLNFCSMNASYLNFLLVKPKLKLIDFSLKTRISYSFLIVQRFKGYRCALSMNRGI